MMRTPALSTSLARAVHEQAGRTPHAPAVRDGDRTLDYRTLEAEATHAAAGLRALRVGPGDAVAVGLPRGWRLVCVMLGVLRLGARVVPLDLQSPAERRDHVLRDSGAAVFVHAGDAPTDPPPRTAAVPVDELLRSGRDSADRPLPPDTAPPVSFLFYTSGTTGRPKGVEVRDSGVLRLAHPGYIRLEETARFACLASPAFDALSFEVWVPLLTGGCCVVLADDDVQSPERLAEVLLRERVDTAFVTAALFHAVVGTVPDCFAGLGQLLVGGEQLNARAVRSWYRHNAGSRTRLYNVYGPTECSTFALCHPVARDADTPVVPIGRALPETGTALVVPGTTRAAAPGEVAELLLSGAGVAAGYRNLPEESARRFVPLPRPDGPPVVHYRTGDLVRRDARGDIEYVGRADRQVKVRGFRVEPGELEQRILAHPAVRQAHVCSRRVGADGPNELLAYLVVDPELAWEDVDRHLAAGLPVYMRPHHLFRIGAVPRTANGKVDEAALLARTDPPWRPDGDAAGATDPWQRELLEMAGQVLGLPDLRPGDTWIACGGDSLKALRLRFEIRRRWNRDLPQSLVLGSDLATLAEAVRAVRTAPDTGAVVYPAVPAAGARSAPATSEQQRLWLLQQQSPHSRAYDVRLAFAVEGDVDVAALRRASSRLVARHPALRTAFEAAPGGLLQVVGEPYDPWTGATERHTSSGAHAAPASSASSASSVSTASPGEGAGGEPESGAGQDAFFAEPFDLSRPRMLRVGLRPSASGSGSVLLLHLHHIAVDGWSLNVLLHDLSEGYAAALAGTDSGPERAAPAPTPLDFAVWQEQWRADPAYDALRTGLLAHYAEHAAPEQAMPQQALTPEARPGAALLHTQLDVVRRAALDRLCGAAGLTRFQVLLAVYAWALYGVTGSTRPRVAAPVAGRPVREFEHSVGMFANTVLLPLDVSPGQQLREQLLRLGRDTQEVLERQDVALADVVQARSPQLGAGSPFDFLFVLENTDFETLTLPDCETSPWWPVPAEAKCPMTLSVLERPDGLLCQWEYAEDHFTPARAAAVADLFRQGVDALTEEPSGTAAGNAAGTVADLVAGYRRSLPEPGRGESRDLAWETVAEGFARQVARTPSAPALMTAQGPVDYRTLDAWAAALAADLLTAAPVPDGEGPCHVALFLEPSAEHVVALLALARLNLTAVPLDPSYPPVLLRQILEQTDPLCVLLPPGDQSAFDAVDPGGLPRRTVTLSEAAAPPLPAHRGGRPLYTLFTSGSTGVPKGVRVYDRTLCNLLQWQEASGGPGGAAATQQFSMLSFDVSFQEIFGTLCAGGCLHLVRPGWRQDVPALLDQLDAAGIERIHLPFVALQMLAEHAVHLGRHPSRLREVVTAGEQLVCTDAVRRWFAGMPGSRLFNQYGPTETHVVSSLCLDGDPSRWPDRPAIGGPVANAVLHVVDEAGQPVPPGCPGELLLGGVVDAPCYLGDGRLNEERFTELPGQGLFYRSGDRARFDADGLLHFLGRADDQIKLSGHRLELGQVEAALLRHPGVVGAVVAVDGAELVACLTCREPTPSAAGLREHLAGLLPAHVRVGRFRLLAGLPRTPSGKLDREAALRAPSRELPAAHHVAAGPTSGREAALAAAFEEATGSAIGSDETYFEAGASSLDLMRFHLHCTTVLGLPLTVADLFEHVTVRRLARFLDSRQSPPDGEPPQPREAAPGTGARTAAGTRAGLGAEPGAASGAHAGAEADTGSGAGTEGIAVVGMAVRAPGAPDLAAFWELIAAGGSGIEYFDAPEGVVGARSQMDGLLAFDPDRFGISRREARLMDPQQRHLLMGCVEALAHAGLADTGAVRVGLVAGAGENTYFQAMLREADPALLPDEFQLALHHDKDFLATKAAYHLGLTGPAFTTQTACSSSLVAVHLAAGLLRQGDADVMLAGGVLVDTSLSRGYRYRPQHIFSADGHCRPFSDDADGTIGGSGVGVLVLKTLSRAREDGDTVYAVITGSAVNNDGSAKLGYSAPSLPGQRAAVRTALRRSGRPGSDVAYVEAHGTGTRLGDPVEAEALRQALGTTEPDHCALSSVKSQIGHLGAAAGAVGLIRAVLSVHHGVIPPTRGFRALNPEIGPDAAPFYVPAEALPWPAGRERVAAVSSFGIGGTNAHLVLEAAPPTRAGAGSAADHGAVPLVVLSAAGASRLRSDAARIADYLERRPDAYGQVLRHLQAGRPQERLRIASVCPTPRSAVAWLRTAAADATGPTAADADADAEVAEIAEVAATAAMAVAGAMAPGSPVSAAQVRSASELAAAWLAGRTVAWPKGAAQAPWDFPPPSFDLADFDFERVAAANSTTERSAAPATAAPVPERLPEAEWLHQPQWVRLRRAATVPRGECARPLVVVADGPADAALVDAFAVGGRRVVWVRASDSLARTGADRFEADPADRAHLRYVIDAVAEDGPPGIDWVHMLPLSLEGAVRAATLDRAGWACLDTPAALLQAVSGSPHGALLRPWWLSRGSRPVHGEVGRPEAALLAGVTEVGPQEGAPQGHWVDLPGTETQTETETKTQTETKTETETGTGSETKTGTATASAPATAPDADTWAPQLAALLAEPETAVLPRQLALRQGYWWEQVLLPVAAAPDTAAPALSAEEGDHLVLGGTGGLGTGIAAWLLAHTPGRVLLLSRHPRLPDALARWAERVELIEADLAAEPTASVAGRIASRTGALASVVHAAGTAAGELVARRDAVGMRQALAPKLRGALLVERLVEEHRPALAVYCSSVSAHLGGVGQFDYAAANALLDAFARHDRPGGGTTARLTLAWDVWRETGMAVRALRGDARHQAHLAVGLTVEEGQRVFARAVGLGLPHLLVSTTDPEASRVFYAAPGAPAARPPGASAHASAADADAADTADGAPEEDSTRELLAKQLCAWLEVDRLDPDASLYDLGADSLTLLSVIETVDRTFGVELDLGSLSHRVSLEEIVERLEEARGKADRPFDAHEVTLQVWQEGTGSDVVCLVHPVGGDIQAYRFLAAALDPRVTVALIADPGLRSRELPGWTITERAHRYLDALRARFPDAAWRWHLAGWSFGAWVAAGMAAEAESAGRPARSLHLLDPPPPGSGTVFQEYDERQLKTVFAAELGMGGEEAGPGEQAETYADRLTRCCRANLLSMAGHRLPRITTTPTRLWLARDPVEGLPQLGTPRKQLAHWRPHLPDLPDSTGPQVLATTHYGVVRPPHAAAVAQVIGTTVAGDTADGPTAR
ncbi:non-ribosomal peptide synthetase [Streptomyces mayonensis]|uniref:non-ribosomal peptide synthetase n=1 Tax=Streptomyces mayonensis TaxID=2750816 RepID=UPI0020A679CA|nr:non-ribosomal peptide synthetase [Streptomyces sp. A108]